VVAAGEAAREERVRAIKGKVENAVNALKQELDRRAQTNETPYTTGAATKFLQALGLNRKDARAVIQERNGIDWRQEVATGRPGNPAVVVPVNSPEARKAKPASETTAAQALQTPLFSPPASSADGGNKVAESPCAARGSEEADLRRISAASPASGHDTPQVGADPPVAGAKRQKSRAEDSQASPPPLAPREKSNSRRKYPLPEAPVAQALQRHPFTPFTADAGGENTPLANTCRTTTSEGLHLGRQSAGKAPPAPAEILRQTPDVLSDALEVFAGATVINGTGVAAPSPMTLASADAAAILALALQHRWPPLTLDTGRHIGGEDNYRWLTDFGSPADLAAARAMLEARPLPAAPAAPGPDKGRKA
jgi:hypothetical protein